MPIFDLSPEMMREIILDHYKNPLHKGVPESPDYKKIHASSTNCIDDFDLYVSFSLDGNIVDAKWDGTACAISSASTDILCEQIIGFDKEKAEHMINEYLKMIEEKEFDHEVLKEALAFKNTGKQAARIHCATMGWTALFDLLERKDSNGGH